MREDYSISPIISDANILIDYIETPYDSLAEASDRPSSLSMQDYVCMRIAEESSWVCATNDKALRRECGRRKISVLWGLEMMLYLVQEGFLKPEKAQETAWAIHRRNKTITEKVVYTFLYQLEEL